MSTAPPLTLVTLETLWRRRRLLLAALIAALVLVGVLGLTTGAMQVPPLEVLRALAGRVGLPIAAEDPLHARIVNELRLPRVLMGALAGAGLALTGACLQALFRNPLADPALIGISGGAATGAALVIVLGGGVLWLPEGLRVYALPAGAFLGALGATALVFHLATWQRRVDAASMLLAGIAINALAGAIIGLLSYLSTDEQLRNLTFWTLGSLAGAGWSSTALVLPAVVGPLLVMFWLAPALNALLMGESVAGHLGFAVEPVKRALVAAGALAVGTTVAFCGVIGFVGLLGPHMARLTVGPDHRFMLPASALWGALLLCGADLAARLVLRPTELPLGVITALIGAPFFIALLRRRLRSGGHA
jgi:iron complex transport system permease protein